MALFGKKKKKEIKNIGPEVGFVLLDDICIDWSRFAKHLESDWAIKITSVPTEEGQLVFEVEGMMVGLGFVEVPVPHQEAEQSAKNNFFWKEAVQVAEHHKAHVIVSVMHGPDAVSQSLLFTKVVASLMKLPEASALYKEPTVLSAEFYMAVAEDIKSGYLPLLNWVYFGMYKDVVGYSGYTYGLTVYGKDEIEVIRTEKDPSDLYDFLVDIAGYVIKQNVVLHDGETIGFSENDKMTITKSKGISVEGESIKIAF